MVPMPGQKITYKKGANGTVYVYLTTRAYRNDKGKPTSDEVAIGKKDLTTGMLIPNTNYFEYYTDAINEDTPRQIKNYGNTYALRALADETGLQGVLQECFAGRWEDILSCAFYMVCKGNVMMYIEDWCDITHTELPDGFTSRRCSELFAAITYEERMRFFESWISVRREKEYIAYDVTSISTYAKSIDSAEWGYNRDGDSLPQINLGMYFGESSHLPVFYNIYSGSISDKSHLVFMMQNTEALGIGKVKFVFDRGFLTEDNLRHMHDNDLPFTVPFPMSRVESAGLIGRESPGIRSAANWIREFELYGRCIDYELYGIKMKAHLFFNPDKCADEEKNLYASIDRLEAELEKMNKSKRVAKRYTDYFVVGKEKNEKLSYERDYIKIDERLRRAGYIVLLTTDLSCSPEELISIYRGRDEIEKSFDSLKNDLDFRRMRTHVNETTDGKVFVAFLALALRSYMSGKIRENAATRKLTTEKVLLELAKIKLVTLSNGKKVLMPLTKMQKQILLALGLQPESVMKSVTS